MDDREQKLQQEILGDAERRARRIVERARRDADKAAQAVRDDMTALRDEHLRTARRQAAERSRAVEAGVQHEIKRRWLTRREDALNALFRSVLADLEAGRHLDRQASLTQLLEEALAALGPGTYELLCRSEDTDVLTPSQVRTSCVRALGAEAADRTRVAIREHAAVTGGLVLRDVDGRRTFDNTYATRLQRLKPDLRALLCTNLPAAAEETPRHE